MCARVFMKQSFILLPIATLRNVERIKSQTPTILAKRCSLKLGTFLIPRSIVLRLSLTCCKLRTLSWRDPPADVVNLNMPTLWLVSPLLSCLVSLHLPVLVLFFYLPLPFLAID